MRNVFLTVFILLLQYLEESASRLVASYEAIGGWMDLFKVFHYKYKLGWLLSICQSFPHQKLEMSDVATLLSAKNLHCTIIRNWYYDKE